VVRTQARANVLRIDLFGRRGEPDEVDEENGDDLALLLGRRRRSERSCAG